MRFLRAITAVSFLFPLTLLAATNLHFKSGSIDPLNYTVSPMGVATSTSVFVVQFKGNIEKQDYKNIENIGGRQLGYFPDEALIVQLKQPGDVHQLNWSNVRAAIPYTSEFKVSSSLKYANVFNAQEQVKMLVRLLHRDFSAEIQTWIELKGEILEINGRNLLIEMNRQNMVSLAAKDGVEFIEVAPEMALHYFPLNMFGPVANANGDYSDLTGYESGTRVMGFEQAWSRGFNGQGQIMGVSDTGLDTGDAQTLHKDFANFKEGMAFGLFSDTWKDPMGHGTHVAGSMMGVGQASSQAVRGGAFGGQIVAQGLWSEMMNNITIPSTLADMYTPAVQAGVRVHNNSWGNPRSMGAYDGMAVQADEFMWQNPEMLLVFAAGNSGVDENKDGRIDPGSVSSPSTAKNVLTVGASENLLTDKGIQHEVGKLAGGIWNQEPLASDKLSNNPNGIAVFSSRGPTDDGRLKPDVVAPGSNILSNCSQVPGAHPLWGKYNNDYCFSGGTSMSSPLVAGAAAVARQYLVEKLGMASPSAAVVKAVLMHNADDLFPGQFGEVGKAKGQELLAPGPNTDQGFGRVNIDRATTEGNYLAMDERQGLRQGEDKVFTVDTKGKSQVRVTLVYTDKPGTASSAKALVNDLALSVEGNGWVGDVNDITNNHEQILVDTRGEDSVKVRVTAKRVNGSDAQAFALVVSPL